MENKDIAIRSTDIGRILENYDTAVLGHNFRATLPTSKIVRLLVSLQGQDVIKTSYLESIALSEFRIGPFELRSAYLPTFEEWGFVRIMNDRIEETIPDRSRVLDRCGKFWSRCGPHDVEKLGIDLFDITATAPRSEEEVNRLASKYSQSTAQSASFHLKACRLTDTFNLKDTKWYYSPEIFGSNYSKTINYLHHLDTKDREIVYGTLSQVKDEQAIPDSVLRNTSTPNIIDQMVSSGLLMGYPLVLNGKMQVFYFTPDLRNRFDSVGRGDKFEIIKSGMSHFQYAYWLANPYTGQLSCNPSVLLDKLISNGRAGNATAIATDYELLLRKGLVSINQTGGGRCEFVLPGSQEKIADLEAIRDAFATSTIMPTGNFEEGRMGLKGKIEPGDSLLYRAARKTIQTQELTKQLMEDMFDL